jgi:uncharacterized membrane protein YfcA
VRALFASPLGFLIGVSLGALGGGGSILAVPALVYGAGQGAKAATTTSLLIVGLTALIGMVAHRRAGHVRLGSGLVFGGVGIGGSLAGSQLNRSVDPDVLLLAFSGLMVVAAWRMWAQARKSSVVAAASGADAATASAAGSPAGVGRGAGAAATLERSSAVDGRTVVKVVVAGSVVGFLTGFFGVGGGFVIVPALVLALRFPMPEAVGTSLLVIAVNSAFALSQRIGTTGIEWRVALPFVVAGLAGVSVGKRLADRVAGPVLARWFVALLVVVAGYTAFRSILAL